ncbi:hypothetical protein Clacol_003654 [Clathrus columnatus]|uniref:Syntaxin n=1 Tax=Clathrus columnatus TaxID=1419009 RepID=A0AAV5A7E5_9AGAM|nr:hypothetical protein Clacol_003654 [Clathrus columnatus]
MTAIHAVRVIGYEQRSKPKTHVVYHIQVQTSVRSWQLWRRYSEFVELHNELRTMTSSEPPVSLPPKHPLSFSRQNPIIIEERQSGLERYLREIVASKDSRWRETRVFNEFLEVPFTSHASVDRPSSQQFTLSSWLDEHSSLQALVRDVMADITKRNSLVDMGDVPASQASNVSAKRKLVILLDKLGILAKGLEELSNQGLAPGELQRRNDMIARLQDDCERLQKMVSAIRSTRQVGVIGQTPSSQADREALLSSSQSKPYTMNVSRVFGAKQAPEETEQTRPLDNHGLLGLQKLQMEQQDDQVARLTTILRRQKQLGTAISQEIEEQNELLDDLTRSVDVTAQKLSTAGKDLRRVG